MINTSLLRAKLIERIQNNKRTQVDLLNQDDGSDHKHSYKKFRQTIKPDNPNFVMTKQAYFVVMACEKCSAKRIIDYIIEV